MRSDHLLGTIQMKNNSNRVSFIFPVYNEESVIEKTLRSYHKEFINKLDFEMIVAEDGSIDRTKEILKKLEPELSFRLFSSDDRKGYLNAVRDALKIAKFEWIFLVDSDNQFDPHDFWKLWSKIDQYDVLLGKKNNRKDGSLRLFLSKGYNLILKTLFSIKYEDIDTGFRLFKRSVSNELSPKVKHLGFFTAEFVIRAHDSGYKIIEIPVRHLKQETRSSNIFHIKKLPFIIFRELKNIINLFIKIRIHHDIKSI